MECSKCKMSIPQGEEREHNKEILCEDCYIDVLSPAAFCDPWATYNAESFNKRNPETAFTASQLKILNTLKESGGLDPEGLADRLTDHMSRQDGERECAALHRMGKISIENRNGSVFICVKN